MEVSEYLVGSPAFKAGDTGDPRMAGSIPVHLRQILPASQLRARWRRYLVGISIVIATITALPGVAGAQARLVESSPVDGASLSNIENIRFEFDSLLIANAQASVTVTRTNGQPISVTDVTVDESVLRARVVEEVPSGTYEIAYAVRSADGGLNEGVLRVSVDSPSQALSGGLLAVIAIFSTPIIVLIVVFTTDKRRRPGRNRPDPASS